MGEYEIEQRLPLLVARSVERFVEKTIIPGTVRDREKKLGRTSERAIYPRMAPMSVGIKTVCLFADISGFTKMTKALSVKGPKGAEQMVQNLNRYLELLVKNIIGAGGDVIKFAGDAIISIWPPKADATLESQEEVLPKHVHQAVQCAWNIQRDIGSMTLGKQILRVKLGVGCGDAMMLHLGGVLARMEAVGVGPAFLDAFRCEEECEAGDVVISGKSYRLIEDRVSVTEPKCGLSKYGNKLITSVTAVKKKSLKLMFQNRMHSSSLLERLHCYIPSAVIPHLKTNETKWAAELRRTANLFMSIEFELSNVTTKNVLDEDTEIFIMQLHNIIRTVQDCVYEYQGSLNKFLFDDKGATVYALFGLPPTAHANDPQRAVLAGLALLERMQDEHNINIWIGCTTGIVYTGLIGSVGQRWEYSAIGNQVNLSARLAGIAKKNKNLPNILCDTSIYENVQGEPRVLLHKEIPQKLKGYDGAINVYSISRNPSFEDTQIVDFKFQDKLHIGQKSATTVANLSKVQDVVDHISRDRPSKKRKQGDSKEKPVNDLYGKVILVEAEMGLGKSQFLRMASSQLKKKAIFAWGKGDCFHCKDGMPVWKQILNKLLTKWGREKPDFKKRFRKFVKMRRPVLQPLMFLVNDLFFVTDPIPIDQRKIDGMTDCQLSHARYDLMFLYIEMIARKRAVVIVIDECQSLVNEDWIITRRICYLVRHRFLYRIAVLLGSRPMHIQCYKPNFAPQKLVDDYLQLRSQNTDHILKPIPWERRTTEEFTMKLLNVFEVSDWMVDVIHERCGGRPGLIVKFVTRIKNFEGSLFKKKKDTKRGVIKAQWIDEIERKLAEGIDVTFDIPPSIWHSTVALLEHVEPEQSIILKTAAVICIGQGINSTRFPKAMLIATHPIPDWRDGIEDSLELLCEWGFLVTKSEPPEELNKLFSRDPMPKVADLLRKPPHDSKEPYKSGVLFKKSLKKFHTEQERLFVFKHNSLYWMLNKNMEHPRNKIKFDGSVLGVVLSGPDRLMIKTVNKTWSLRSESKETIDSWHNFLKERVKEQYSSKGASLGLYGSDYKKLSKRKQDSKSGVKMAEDFDLKVAEEQTKWYEGLTTEERQSLKEQVRKSKRIEDLGLDISQRQAEYIYNLYGHSSGPLYDFGEDDSNGDEPKFYEFSFGFLRDVIYTAMLYSQRRLLHLQCKHQYTKKKDSDLRYGILEERNQMKANS